MATSTNSLLPKQSEAQRIGKAAVKCFTANIPDSWNETSMSGDNDYGFDFTVQVTEDSQVAHLFRLQLKGTENPNFIDNNTVLSIALKASTVRLYQRVTEPIMLVVAVLKKGEKAKDCPLYYVWIHEELKRVDIEGVPDDQDSLTLNVPLANILDDELDVLPVLNEERILAQFGPKFDAMLSQHNNGMPTSDKRKSLDNILRNIEASKSDLLQVLIEEPTEGWPQAKEGTFQYRLNVALNHLRVGNTEDAATVLEDRSILDGATPIQQADYYNAVGKLHSYRFELNEARDAFWKACELSGNLTKHIHSWAENELRVRIRQIGNIDFADVLLLVKGDDDSSKAMRSRLLSASGKNDAALEIAKEILGKEGIVARVIIYITQGDYENALLNCEAGLQNTGNPENIKRLFHIFKARAKFNLAMGGEIATKHSNRIPASGLPETDLNTLYEAWESIQAAVASLKSTGWFANAEYIVDIWSAVATVLDKAQEVQPLLVEASIKQPKNEAIQAELEQMSIFVGDWNQALKASYKQTETPDLILKRIIILYLNGKHNECAALYQEKVNDSYASCEGYGSATMHAILSANQVLRTDLVSAFRQKLESNTSQVARLALTDYHLAKANNRLDTDVAFLKLLDTYEKFGKPFDLALTLVMGINADNESNSSLILSLAEEISKSCLLPADVVIQKCQALITLSRWDDVIVCTSQALKQYKNNDRFVAIEALALDRLGKSNEALKQLRALVENGSNDDVALNTYLNIVLRCGYYEESVSLLERLIAGMPKGSNIQIHPLKLLFRLTHLKDPASDRLAEIAWRIGDLTDPNDVTSEGLFIIMMRTAVPIKEDHPRLQEYINREEKYFERFPNSPIIRSFEIPKAATGHEFLSMLNRLVGPAQNKLPVREKAMRDLERGEAPIPYAFRPNEFVVGIHDLLSFWMRTKISKPHEKQFHINMTPPGWVCVDPDVLIKSRPILDLPTILILYDLSLLELIFEIFPTIAIGQATLGYLANLINPLAGSYLIDLCKGVQTVLKTYSNQIEQPRGKVPEEESPRARHWHAEEIKELITNAQYALYSDDVLFRYYCDISDTSPQPICTLDVLNALEHFGKISTLNASKAVSRLCSWHFGLIVNVRYQAAILPDDLGTARSISEGFDILHNNTEVKAIFNEIWDFTKSLPDLIGHASSVMKLLILNGSSVISIGALMSFWFTKIKLHPKLSISPLEILALVTVSATNGISINDRNSLGRLWSIYIDLVEFEFQSRMEKSIELEAIKLAAKYAVEFDKAHKLSDENSSASKIRTRFASQTEEYEAFLAGVNS